MIAAIHTFGELIHRHAHIRAFVSDGAFTPDGTFIPAGNLPSDPSGSSIPEVDEPTPQEAEAAAAAEITTAADKAIRDVERELDRDLGKLGEP